VSVCSAMKCQCLSLQDCSIYHSTNNIINTTQHNTRKQAAAKSESPLLLSLSRLLLSVNLFVSVGYFPSTCAYLHHHHHHPSLLLNPCPIPVSPSSNCPFRPYFPYPISHTAAPRPSLHRPSAGNPKSRCVFPNLLASLHRPDRQVRRRGCDASNVVWQFQFARRRRLQSGDSLENSHTVTRR
jgi:hypothetical protein